MRYAVKDPLSYGTSAANARRYEPGETVEMDAETAAPLLASGVLEASPEPEPKKGKK